MKRYCVLYNELASLTHYRIISTDDDTFVGLWEVETEIKPMADEEMAKKIVRGLNMDEGWEDE